MTILYLANVRMPTEMAHGAQIAKACEAFVAAGEHVELVVPERWTPIQDDFFTYYGLAARFTLTKLKVPDVVRKWGRLGFLMQILLFSFAAARYAKRAHPDIVYGRDEHVLALAYFFGVRRITWESHDGAWNRAARYLARRAERMVVVSNGQKDFYLRHGVPAERILDVPNGVDVEAFAHSESKETARKRLGIPEDKCIAMYVGAFGGWKGTDTLFQSAALLPDSVRVVVIGGYPAQVEAAKRKYPRVLFLGERPYRELAGNLAAADACVLPNTGKDPVSVSFTSPLKLLGYMAAGKPIVASDLPSIRELAGDAVLYVAPDDTHALAEGIERTAKEAKLASALGAKAQERAKAYSWSARTERILRHLKETEPVSLLAIYRGRLTENRGTPIRVRSILERLARDSRFSLTVASWDDSLPFSAAHLHLTNSKFSDIASLYRVMREKRVRVAMGHTMATWYYLLFLKLFSRARIALEMHGFLEIEARFYGSIGPLRYGAEKTVYRLFYPLCDLITTCSENAAEILKRYNRNVVPLYGGVDTEMFRPDILPGDLFAREAGEVVIGYAGNMRKWQGVPFLVDAFGKLRAQDASFKLVILSSEKKHLPSGDGITVVGEVPHHEVPSFLVACDILVMPRLIDEVSSISFPSKLPEYMAMGKPVVASATSDAHRVIRDGADGFVFPPGDTDAFLGILRKLKDKSLRGRIGTAARRTAEERFSWERQAAIVAERLLLIS